MITLTRLEHSILELNYVLGEWDPQVERVEGSEVILQRVTVLEALNSRAPSERLNSL